MPLKTPQFWYRSSFWGDVCKTALVPIACLYQCISRIHKRSKSSQTVDIPVICIGNLTAGGGGKTPTVLALVTLLKESGIVKKPYILSRGYGGKRNAPTVIDLQKHTVDDAGDEPIMMAHYAPVIVSRNRYDGAKMAQSLDADMIIMDDGFYNYDLHHDIDICVVDSVMGFGNGETLPAGPLREPLDKGLRRADAFIVIGDTMPDYLQTDTPVFHAKLTPAIKDDLPKSPLVAFCGLAYPDKFFAFLKNDLGLTLKKTHAFPDHHVFSDHDFHILKSHNAPLMTTEKDYVRIPESHRIGIISVPVTLQFENAGDIITFIKNKIL